MGGGEENHAIVKNKEFYRLLHWERDSHHRPVWTSERLAREIYSNRAHVTEVLNNKPKRGHVTRWKLAQCLKKHFARWEEMLSALGWAEQIGRIKEEMTPPEDSNVPVATFYVERSS